MITIPSQRSKESDEKSRKRNKSISKDSTKDQEKKKPEEIEKNYPSLKEMKSVQNEYSMDYNHVNYISKMTKYIEQKKRMLQFDSQKELDLDRTSVMMVNSNKRLAIERNMVFTLYGYYPVVRHTLTKLGWLERVDPRIKTKYCDIPVRPDFTVTFLDSAPIILQNETVESVHMDFQKWKLTSSLLENETPNLVFALKKTYITWNTLREDTIVSYFPRCNFSSKFGLKLCLENMRQFQCNNDSLMFPRCHIMSSEGSVRRFIQDFRETLCFSLMRFIKESHERNRVISSRDGSIPWTMFDFAETICKTRLNRLQLENVAGHPANRYELSESKEEAEKWLNIGEEFYNLISGTNYLTYIYDMQKMYIRANTIIKRFEELAKMEIFEGAFNTWVVKPVANCSGRGIKVYHKMKDIKNAIYPLRTQDNNYIRFILQKYIERPLLIYGVKFDLRVWYLVTTINKMKIWVYQEGYVRFCSKPYSHIVLEESRHLTNVRIQRQYRVRRDPQLPPELMWDFRRLKEYLTDKMNQPNMWDNIMKTMEESIVTTMQSAMTVNQIELRKNSFQLFGADFLIHENFHPCLIEVNNGPGLSPTTSIIAKKTTELLADIARLITYERIPITCNRNSVDPGNFHLVYVKDVTQPTVPSKENVMEGMISRPIDLREWRKHARTRRIVLDRKKYKLH